MDANIPEKSMPYTYEKPWATSLTLNLATDPLVLYLTLKIHFNPIAFLPENNLLYTNVW